MNYFAHGRHYVNQPYYLAGTAVPDWLSVVDRRLRIRGRQALAQVEHPDRQVALVAGGILQHLRDDAWFHETRAFAELSLELARQVRQRLPDDEGFRPHFLGHILVEILLDATLIAAEPQALENYYRVLDELDGAVIERAVEELAQRPSESYAALAKFVGLFSRERFLWDYLDDAKLLFRLNQVMRRVRLPALPADFADGLPEARRLVAQRADELLTAPSAPSETVPTAPSETAPLG